MFLLWHPWLTTTNLSYSFPLLETSATALCGTTGISFACTILHLHTAKWIDRNCKLLNIVNTNSSKPFHSVLECSSALLAISKDWMELAGDALLLQPHAPIAISHSLQDLHKSLGFELESTMHFETCYGNQQIKFVKQSRILPASAFFSGFGFSASGVTWAKSMTALGSTEKQAKQID